MTLKHKNPMILTVLKMSKFITRLLRQSQQVNREEDGRVHYDQVIDEWKEKVTDNTGYWSDEMKKHFANAPHWSIDKRISVLAKGGGQKKRFQYRSNRTDPTYIHRQSQSYWTSRAIRCLDMCTATDHGPRAICPLKTARAQDTSHTHIVSTW